MRILICYATTEGQTRKICRFVADHLMDKGHSVELLSADDGLDEASELDLNRFDAAVLQRNVQAAGASMQAMMGAQHQELARWRPESQRLGLWVPETLGCVLFRVQFTSGTISNGQYRVYFVFALQ